MVPHESAPAFSRRCMVGRLASGLASRCLRVRPAGNVRHLESRLLDSIPAPSPPPEPAPTRHCAGGRHSTLAPNRQLDERLRLE
ncbi:hypothetical protein chiPu_0026028 [Chiloscyllium punctatum]|uniref:Uncharacterized protein n=1 Tax=Chiloscyllium punctatum TaxID=137246 RepID=A0A401TI92_CHIPU|nr:hypothetical protein [Chiloscyllium punctatum]